MNQVNFFYSQDLRHLNTEKVEKYLFLLTVLENNLMEYDFIKKDLDKVIFAPVFVSILMKLWPKRAGFPRGDASQERTPFFMTSCPLSKTRWYPRGLGGVVRGGCPGGWFRPTFLKYLSAPTQVFLNQIFNLSS